MSRRTIPPVDKVPYWLVYNSDMINRQCPAVTKHHLVLYLDKPNGVYIIDKRCAAFRRGDITETGELRRTSKYYAGAVQHRENRLRQAGQLNERQPDNPPPPEPHEDAPPVHRDLPVLIFTPNARIPKHQQFDKWWRALKKAISDWIRQKYPLLEPISNEELQAKEVKFRKKSHRNSRANNTFKVQELQKTGLSGHKLQEEKKKYHTDHILSVAVGKQLVILSGNYRFAQSFSKVINNFANFQLLPVKDNLSKGQSEKRLCAAIRDGAIASLKTEDLDYFIVALDNLKKMKDGNNDQQHLINQLIEVGDALYFAFTMYLGNHGNQVL